jgi:hypothetical protein
MFFGNVQLVDWVIGCWGSLEALSFLFANRDSPHGWAAPFFQLATKSLEIGAAPGPIPLPPSIRGSPPRFEEMKYGRFRQSRLVV